MSDILVFCSSRGLEVSGGAAHHCRVMRNGALTSGNGSPETRYPGRSVACLDVALSQTDRYWSATFGQQLPGSN